MPPPTALGQILVAQRFARPNRLVGFLLGKTPYGVLATTTGSVCPGSSSIAKLAARISRELVDLETPNKVSFTRTTMPTYSTSTSDMTSPASSGRKLSRKNGQKCRLRRLPVELIENGFVKDHEILQTYQGLSAL